MKATIDKPMILKAAATLANGGYKSSILQFERQGGKLKMFGTNCYVMVRATLDAKFSRWPDGDGFMFQGSEVQAMMRGIGKALKDAESVTVEVVKGAAVVTMEVKGSSVAASFPFEKSGNLIGLTELDAKLQAESANTPQSVASYFMGLASNAMRTIGGEKHSKWTINHHGDEGPIEFLSKEEPAQVLLMPVVR